MNKKRNLSQILFPCIILSSLIIVLVISAFRPPQTFKVVSMDSPGYMHASWRDIDEETFFNQLSVAIVVEITNGPTYYTLQEPWDERAIPIESYEFFIGDVLAGPLTTDDFQAGITQKVSAMSNSLTLLSSDTQDIFLLFLRDRRDTPSFTPHEGYSVSYYNEYFEMFGYDIITPIVSIVPVSGDGKVKTDLLPEYLQSTNEYTTYQELSDILCKGRIKYGLLQ